MYRIDLALLLSWDHSLSLYFYENCYYYAKRASLYISISFIQGYIVIRELIREYSRKLKIFFRIFQKFFEFEKQILDKILEDTIGFDQ